MLRGVRPGVRARRQRPIFVEEMERIRACFWFCLSEGGISSALGSCKQRRILCCTNAGDAVLCHLQSGAKPTTKTEISPQKGVAHHHRHSQTSLSPLTWVRPWPRALDSHSTALRTPARPSAAQSSCEAAEGNHRAQGLASGMAESSEVIPTPPKAPAWGQWHWQGPGTCGT